MPEYSLGTSPWPTCSGWKTTEEPTPSFRLRGEETSAVNRPGIETINYWRRHVFRPVPHLSPLSLPARIYALSALYQ